MQVDWRGCGDEAEEWAAEAYAEVAPKSGGVGGEAFAEVAPETAAQSKRRSLMSGKDATAEAGPSAASAEGRRWEARRLLVF